MKINAYEIANLFCHYYVDDEIKNEYPNILDHHQTNNARTTPNMTNQTEQR
jgi:hypothetical protein